VVGGLLVVQDRHGRQYAGQVAGQEDHRIRLATEVLLGTLLDVLQRVGRAAVLGQAGIGVVGRRVRSSSTTFSSTAPNLMAFQITGSFFSDRSMHLA